MALKHLTISLKKWRSLLVIILAALLLEGISGTQYYLTRQIMEGELEKRAESELTLKAILIKSNLKDAEDILDNSLWKIQAHIDQPDSAYTTMQRLVAINPKIRGAGVAFEPYYYPQKGQLYEIYSLRTATGKVITRQIGGQNHDYTKYDFYQKTISSGKSLWADPYLDKEGAHGLITSFSKPVCDRKGKVVGAAMIDMSLKWLADTIDNRHIYPSSFIMVLTENDKPVIHSDSMRVSTSTKKYIYNLITDSTVTRQKSSSGRSTVIHFDTDKRDGTIFYANMKGQPHWKIAVVCYDDEVYAPLAKLRLKLLFLMLIAFGILLYVVWRFVRGEKTMASTSQLLKKKTQEQERMSAELRIANGIQQALLPIEETSMQDVCEVLVEGRLIPAKAVGGDLYNVFMRDGKLFFCIGDVSGKGVPAALIMAVMQTLFHNIASHEDNPAHIMTQINLSACRNNRQNIFVTLFIGVLDLPTGHLRYCNAGHEVPIVIGNGEIENPITGNQRANIPVGLFSNYTYTMHEMTLQPGTTLFLYTDGLTEARNASRRLLGKERVEEMLTRCNDMQPKEIIENIIAEVNRYGENTEQSDDLTLLVIKYTPPKRPLTLDEQLILPNDVKEVSRLSIFVKDVMTRLGIGKPLAPKLRLALEEAVVNVMEYAYPAGTKGDVSIRVTYDEQRLRLIITDTGIAFNPTEAAAADTTLSAKERPVGGLGILFIRELMDSINYERIDDQNILTLTKKIERKE